MVAATDYLLTVVVPAVAVELDGLLLKAQEHGQLVSFPLVSYLHRCVR